ncbi:helix-turn-helix domain-containing protein [Streptomyces sp. NPDC101062]|uniref:helix-turn-helix domain-containing protein n=1 Tax=unclassified Streptomyces TaxID=2593676 RepID=UPI0037FA81F2
MTVAGQPCPAFLEPPFFKGLITCPASRTSSREVFAAMLHAQISDRQLAERCGVDIKTIGRWITETGRIPRARHRWAVCEALGEEEAALWPAAAAKAIKVGPDREIVSVYPYRSGCPASLWRSLIAGAEGE